MTSVTYLAGARDCRRLCHSICLAIAFCTMCHRAVLFKCTKSLDCCTCVRGPGGLSIAAMTTLGSCWEFWHSACLGVNFCSLSGPSAHVQRGGKSKVTLFMGHCLPCDLTNLFKSIACCVTVVLGFPLTAAVRSVIATISLLVGVISGLVMYQC
jgi:hypothetical protein